MFDEDSCPRKGLFGVDKQREQWAKHVGAGWRVGPDTKVVLFSKIPVPPYLEGIKNLTIIYRIISVALCHADSTTKATLHEGKLLRQALMATATQLVGKEALEVVAAAADAFHGSSQRLEAFASGTRCKTALNCYSAGGYRAVNALCRCPDSSELWTPVGQNHFGDLKPLHAKEQGIILQGDAAWRIQRAVSKLRSEVVPMKPCRGAP